MIIYEAADIMAKLIAGELLYAPNAFYIEFKNGVAPTPPTINLAEGRSYYAGLETLHGSTFVDYLRVPRQFPPAVSSSDVAKYVGNKLTFTVASQGTVGICGLDFSAAANSVIYGAALVSVLDWTDRTKDLVFARYYPATALAKGAASEVNIQWPFAFT